MNPDEFQAPVRVSALLRRHVRRPGGELLGRIADLETRGDSDGRQRIIAVIVTAGRWGRLLGYERDQRTGPWLLEQLARHLMRRHTVRVPWDSSILLDGRPDA
jgi:hypothetical protein